jgi:hypothetical protein
VLVAGHFGGEGRPPGDPELRRGVAQVGLDRVRGRRRGPRRRPCWSVQPRPSRPPRARWGSGRPIRRWRARCARPRSSHATPSCGGVAAPSARSRANGRLTDRLDGSGFDLGQDAAVGHRPTCAQRVAHAQRTGCVLGAVEREHRRRCQPDERRCRHPVAAAPAGGQLVEQVSEPCGGVPPREQQAPTGGEPAPDDRPHRWVGQCASHASSRTRCASSQSPAFDVRPDEEVLGEQLPPAVAGVREQVVDERAASQGLVGIIIHERRPIARPAALMACVPLPIGPASAAPSAQARLASSSAR